MVNLPPLDGLGWAKLRQVATDLVGTAPDEDLIDAARREIAAPAIARRLLGVFLLGFTSGANPGNLAILRERVAPDPSWEVSAMRRPCRRSTPGWPTGTPTRGAQ